MVNKRGDGGGSGGGGSRQEEVGGVEAWPEGH